MKRVLLSGIIASIIFCQCNREKLNISIDFSGGWYIDHIEDEISGNIYPSLIPFDSIIIYFANDSLYSGKTHNTLYSGKYTYNDDSLITFTYPLFYTLPQDSLGSRFFDLLRACRSGNYPCRFTSSVVTLINGNELIIKNQSHYKGFFKKI